MSITLETLSLQIEVNHQQLVAGLNKATKEVDDFASKTTKSFSLLKTAVAGVFAKEFVTTIVNAASAMQSLDARLTASTGSSALASEAMAFLSEASKKQSVNLIDLADGYTRLLPAVKTGALSMDEMRNILTLVNDNMKAFGISAGDSRAIFYGLSQLLGSGVVTMENLKQVTEHLPGSLNALAEATGRSLSELVAWVSTGQVTAEMIKGPLTEALNANAGAAEAMSGTYASAQINLANALSEASKASGVLAPATVAVNLMADAVGAWARQSQLAEIAGRNLFDAEKARDDKRLAMSERGRAILAQRKADDDARIERAKRIADAEAEIAKGAMNGPQLPIGPQQPVFNPSPSIKPDAEEPNVSREKLVKDQEEIDKKDKDRKLKIEEDWAKVEEEIRKIEYDEAKKQRERLDALIYDSQDEMERKSRQFTQRLVLAEKLGGEQKVKATVFAYKDILSEAAKHNKTMFEINKGVGIASAVVSTAQGIMRCFSDLGPIAGAVAATGVAIAGAAQIATIMSTSYQGGGGGGGASAMPSIASSTSGGGDSGGGGSTNSMNINISGVDSSSMYSGAQVRQLISAINEEIGNGATIKGVSIG